MAVGTVAYSSPFVPAEWIVAHGFEPRRVVPRASGVAAVAGVCPFAHDFLMAVLAMGIHRSSPGTAVPGLGV
ncbi:MAG: hypothetical protein FWD53_13600, partial [Phycisphaerales bacterium]|nr:hypothetical protein [Phycisphaerales bacterium]